MTAHFSKTAPRAPNLYRPSIHRKNDGLLLVTCTGQGRFLTWPERLQLWLGITDADKLERKICRSAWGQL